MRANAVAQRRREIGIRVAVMSSAVVHDGRIYVGCDDEAVYSVRLEEGPPPRRAVFWDEERSRWNALAGYENARDYFESFGYQVVDRFQLQDFMESSNHDEPGPNGIQE